jgi:hypothetical protein
MTVVSLRGHAHERDLRSVGLQVISTVNEIIYSTDQQQVAGDT